MPGFVQGIGGGQRVFKNFAKIVGRYIKQAAILSAANIGFPQGEAGKIRQKYKLPPKRTFATLGKAKIAENG